MDDLSAKARQSKQSKIYRKSRQQKNLPTSLRKNSPICNERQSGSVSGRSSTRGDISRLNDLINDMTSEGDEGRGSFLPGSQEKLVEPNSPVPNENRLIPFPLPVVDSASGSRENYQRKKKNRFSKGNGRTRSGSQQPENVGEVRREQLTECFETFRTYWESAQNANIIYSNDKFQNEAARNVYQKSLWFVELILFLLSKN